MVHEISDYDIDRTIKKTSKYYKIIIKGNLKDEIWATVYHKDERNKESED